MSSLGPQIQARAALGLYFIWAHCNNAEHDSAERELREALINWRENLAAGADLNTTTLRRRFSPRVFKHDQRPPPAVSFIQRYWRRFLLNSWWKWYDNAHNTVRVRDEAKLSLLTFERAFCCLL